MILFNFYFLRDSIFTRFFSTLQCTRRLFLLLFLILNACGNGCISNDNNQNWQATNPLTVYPININIVQLSESINSDDSGIGVLMQGAYDGAGSTFPGVTSLSNCDVTKDAACGLWASPTIYKQTSSSSSNAGDIIKSFLGGTGSTTTTSTSAATNVILKEGDNIQISIGYGSGVVLSGIAASTTLRTTPIDNENAGVNIYQPGGLTKDVSKQQLKFIPYNDGSLSQQGGMIAPKYAKFVASPGSTVNVSITDAEYKRGTAAPLLTGSGMNSITQVQTFANNLINSMTSNQNWPMVLSVGGGYNGSNYIQLKYGNGVVIQVMPKIDGYQNVPSSQYATPDYWQCNTGLTGSYMVSTGKNSIFSGNNTASISSCAASYYWFSGYDFYSNSIDTDSAIFKLDSIIPKNPYSWMNNRYSNIYNANNDAMFSKSSNNIAEKGMDIFFHTFDFNTFTRSEDNLIDPSLSSYGAADSTNFISLSSAQNGVSAINTNGGNLARTRYGPFSGFQDTDSEIVSPYIGNRVSGGILNQGPSISSYYTVPYPFLMPRWELDLYQDYASGNFAYDVWPIKSTSGYIIPYMAYSYGNIFTFQSANIFSQIYATNVVMNLPVPYRTQTSTSTNLSDGTKIEGLTLVAQDNVFDADFVKCTVDWRNPGWAKMIDQSSNNLYYYNTDAVNTSASKLSYYTNINYNSFFNTQNQPDLFYYTLQNALYSSVLSTGCNGGFCQAKFPLFKEGDYVLSGTIYNNNAFDASNLDSKYNFALTHAKFGGLMRTPVLKLTSGNSSNTQFNRTYYKPNFKAFYPKQLIYIKNILSDPLNARGFCTFSVNNATNDYYRMDMSFPLTENIRNAILDLDCGQANSDYGYCGSNYGDGDPFGSSGQSPWEFFARTRLFRAAFTAGMITPKWHKLTNAPISYNDNVVLTPSNESFLIQNGIGMDLNNTLNPVGGSYVDKHLNGSGQTFYNFTQGVPYSVGPRTAKYCGTGLSAFQMGYPITHRDVPISNSTEAYLHDLSLNRVYNADDYYSPKWPGVGNQTLVGNQFKQCGTGVAFRVVPLPTLSCIKGYKLRCINPRINDYVDNSTATADMSTHDQTTYNLCRTTDINSNPSGGCYASVTPNISGASTTNYAMRYYVSNSQASNTVQLNQLLQVPIAPYSKTQESASYSGVLTNYSQQDNISNIHCGYCIPNSLIVKNGTDTYIPSSANLNLFNQDSTVNLAPLAGLIAGSYYNNIQQACATISNSANQIPMCLSYMNRSDCSAASDATWVTNFYIYQDTGLTANQQNQILAGFINSVDSIITSSGSNYTCSIGSMNYSCSLSTFVRNQDFLNASNGGVVNKCLSYLDGNSKLQFPNCNPDTPRSCSVWTDSSGKTITPICNPSTNIITNVVSAANVAGTTTNLNHIFQHIATGNNVACVNAVNTIYLSMYNFFLTDYNGNSILIDPSLNNQISIAMNKQSASVCNALISTTAQNVPQRVSMTFVQNDYTGMCIDDKNGNTEPIMDTGDANNEVSSLTSINAKNSTDPNACNNPYFVYVNPCLSYTGANGSQINPNCNPDPSATDPCTPYISNGVTITPQCNNFAPCNSYIDSDGNQVNPNCNPDQSVTDPCAPYYNTSGKLMTPQCNNFTCESVSGAVTGNTNLIDVPYYRTVYGVNASCNANETPVADLNGTPIVYTSYLLDGQTINAGSESSTNIAVDPCVPYVLNGATISPNCNPDPSATDPCAPYVNSQGVEIVPMCNFTGIMSTNNTYSLNGVTVYAQDDIDRISIGCDTCNPLTPNPSLYYQDVTVGQTYDASSSSSGLISTGSNGYTCTYPYISQNAQYEDACYSYKDPWFAVIPSDATVGATCQSYTNLPRISVNLVPETAPSVPNATLTAPYSHTDYIGLINTNLLNLDTARNVGLDPNGVPYLPVIKALLAKNPITAQNAVNTIASTSSLPGNYLCCDPQNAYYCNTNGTSPAVTSIGVDGTATILGYKDPTTGNFRSAKDCFIIPADQIAQVGKTYNCRLIPDTSSFTPSAGVDSQVSVMSSLNFYSNGCNIFDTATQTSCPAGQYEDGYSYIDEIGSVNQYTGLSAPVCPTLANGDKQILISSSTTSGGSGVNTATGASPQWKNYILVPNSVTLSSGISTYINPLSYSNLASVTSTNKCLGYKEVVNDPFYGTDTNGNVVSLSSNSSATALKINDKLCSSESALYYYPNLVYRNARVTPSSASPMSTSYFRIPFSYQSEYFSLFWYSYGDLGKLSYSTNTYSITMPTFTCTNGATPTTQTITTFDKIYVPMSATCGQGPYKEYYLENLNPQCQLYNNSTCSQFTYNMCGSSLNQQCSNNSTSNLDVTNMDSIYGLSTSDLPAFGSYFSSNTPIVRSDSYSVQYYNKIKKDFSTDLIDNLSLFYDIPGYSYKINNQYTLLNNNIYYVDFTIQNQSSIFSYSGLNNNLYKNTNFNFYTYYWPGGYNLDSLAYWPSDCYLQSNTIYCPYSYSSLLANRPPYGYYDFNSYIHNNYYYYNSIYTGYRLLPFFQIGGYYNQSPHYSRYKQIILYNDSSHTSLNGGKLNYIYDYGTNTTNIPTIFDGKYISSINYTSTFANNFQHITNKTLQNDSINTANIVNGGSIWARDTTYYPCNNENPNNYGYNCYLLGQNLNRNLEFLTNTGNSSGYIKGLQPDGTIIPNGSGSNYASSLMLNNAYLGTTQLGTVSGDSGTSGGYSFVDYNITNSTNSQTTAILNPSLSSVNLSNLFTPVTIKDNNNRSILIIDTLSRLYHRFSDSSPQNFASNYFWDNYYFYRNSYNPSNQLQNIVSYNIYNPTGSYSGTHYFSSMVAPSTYSPSTVPIYDSNGNNILGGLSLYAYAQDTSSMYITGGNMTSNWPSVITSGTSTTHANPQSWNNAYLLSQAFQVARDFKVCTRPTKTTIVTCGNQSSLNTISKSWFNQVALAGGVPVNDSLNYTLTPTATTTSLTQPITSAAPIKDTNGNLIPLYCIPPVNGSCPAGTISDSGMCRNFSLCNAVSYNITCGTLNRKVQKVCRNYKTCRRPYQEVRYCKQIVKRPMIQCKKCQQDRQTGELTSMVPKNLQNFYAYNKTNTTNINVPNQVTDNNGNSVSFSSADLLFYIAPPVNGPSNIGSSQSIRKKITGCNSDATINNTGTYYSDTQPVNYLCGIENRYNQFSMASLDDIQKGIKVQFTNAITLSSGEPLYFYLQPLNSNGDPDPNFAPETYFKNWSHYDIANCTNPKVYKFTDYNSGTTTANFTAPVGGGKLWFIILDQYQLNPSTGQNKFPGQDGKRIDFFDANNTGVLQTVNGQNYNAFNAGQYNLNLLVQYNNTPSDPVLVSLMSKMNTFISDILIKPIKNILFGTFDSAKNEYNWTDGLVYQISTLITGQIIVQILYYFAIIMYVFVYGLNILIGKQKIEVKEILGDIVRFSIVNAFVSPATWSLYQEIVVKMLFRFTEGFIVMTSSVFTGSSTMVDAYASSGLQDPGFGDVSATLNFILQQNTILRILAIAFSSWTGWLVTIMIGISIAVFIINIYKALFVYIGNILVIAIYLAIGPLAIIALGHPATRDMFDKWWRGLLSSAAQQIAMFIGLGIFAGIYNNLLQNMLNFTICMEPVLQIPIINITLFSMWKIAGSLPSMFMAYMGNPPGSGDAPAISIFDGLALYFVVVMMDKFTNEAIEYGAKLFGGSVNDMTKSIQGAFDAVKGNLTVSNALGGIKGLIKG